MSRGMNPAVRAHGMLVATLVAATTNLFTPAGAEDWPTYQHDDRRSGITSERLGLPLSEVWTYAAPAPPRPAWSGPAKWDAYAEIKDLASMRNFDPAFFVTAVADRAFFGSSVDNAVHCLDARTGREQWAFFADGAVRFPPTCHQGKVYFGSDDGYVYCLDGAQGSLLWKYRAGPDERQIPSDTKLISPWPCRTSVVVQDGKVYFGASLLPWKDSYLCSLDAASGSDSGAQLFRLPHRGLLMQGAMLASATNLYVSQGRSAPLVFNRATGRLLGAFGESGNGGTYALLTTDDVLIHGRGQNHGSHGELRGFDAKTKDHLATFPNATCMVVTDKVAYLQGLQEFAAFDRIRYLEIDKRRNALITRRDEINKQVKDLMKKAKADEARKLAGELKPINEEIGRLAAQLPACFLWKQPAKHHHALILAGDVLFAGGTNEVAAFTIADGKVLWQANVVGKAHGLAVANGCLFVSTDRGKIYCFAGK
jgi:outer membrane protein assembly factor BamB